MSNGRFSTEDRARAAADGLVRRALDDVINLTALLVAVRDSVQRDPTCSVGDPYASVTDAVVKAVPALAGPLANLLRAAILVHNSKVVGLFEDVTEAMRGIGADLHDEFAGALAFRQHVRDLLPEVPSEYITLEHDDTGRRGVRVVTRLWAEQPDETVTVNQWLKEEKVVVAGRTGMWPRGGVYGGVDRSRWTSSCTTVDVEARLMAAFPKDAAASAGAPPGEEKGKP